MSAGTACVAETPSPEAIAEARRQRLLETYAGIRSQYTPDQLRAIQRLYTAAKTMLDTSGGSCCA